MGLNIHVYEHNPQDPKTTPFFKEFRDWDSSGYAGDKEFWHWIMETENGICKSVPERKPEHKEMWVDYEFYYRPKFLDEARHWVSLNIESKGNQERFYNIFCEMDKNENIYFNFSI